MMKVIIEVNGKTIRTVMATRVGALKNEPGESHDYSVAAIDHETSKKVMFYVKHEYARGALRLAEKMCGFSARKLQTK